MSDKPSASEKTIQKSKWQTSLFAHLIDRMEILGSSANWDCHPVQIRVHRNHAFEHLTPFIEAYAAYGDWLPQWSYSDYDDALNFELAAESQLEILWLDSSRYRQPLDIAGWLYERIDTLRKMTNAPILVATWLENDAAVEQLNSICSAMPSVYFANLGEVRDQLGDGFFDARMAKLAGSPLSGNAQMHIARKLACHWLPTLLFPRLKGIVVDLDNTLYEGVLGEDGIDGVVLTEAHLSLHRQLLDWRKQGIFLALASKNDEADVRNLFAQREDFILKLEDFSAVAVNWNSKAQNIRAIADELRIGIDSLLFVDDNAGELTSVSEMLPTIKTIHAQQDAGGTCMALNFMPGLWRWSKMDEDSKRIQDLAANKARQAASSTLSKDEYLRSLGVVIDFFINPKAQSMRIAELSQKTNQFNLCMRRYSEMDVLSLLNDPDVRTISVGLSDNLSDSGIIGLLIVRSSQATLELLELCISCRALGRGLEDDIILGALNLLPFIGDADHISAKAVVGERNQPAREWFERISGNKIESDGEIILKDTKSIMSFNNSNSLVIRVHDHVEH